MGKSLSKVVWCDPNVFDVSNTKLYYKLKDRVDLYRFFDFNEAY